jgi:hypothetical protein
MENTAGMILFLKENHFSLYSIFFNIINLSNATSYNDNPASFRPKKTAKVCGASKAKHWRFLSTPKSES